MENVLLILTLASSAVAIAMTAIVVKMLREERRRSDARVEALVRLASSGTTSVEAGTLTYETDGSAAAFDRHVGQESARADTEPYADYVFDDPSSDTDAGVTGVGGLFAEPDAPSPWPRRLGIAVSAALVVVLVGVGLTSLAGGPRSTAAPAATSLPDASASLELLSLTHEKRSDTLTISGVVQNPKANASPLAGVQATALLFAADGSVLATGGAPLDFSRLRPGDESPFVVRVPVKGAVARYRIGFRDAEGRVIAHVDRRAASPLARNE